MKNKITPTENNHNAIDGLSLMLADTYVLYLKTQNFHWNVTGPHFSALHKMFEDQYRQLAEAVDVIAERIRALKAPAPASFTQFLKLASLEEADNNLSADEMVQELLNDHESIAKSISKLFVIMQQCGDEVTLDMLIERKNEHDKTAWMLRSTLGLA